MKRQKKNTKNENSGSDSFNNNTSYEGRVVDPVKDELDRQRWFGWIGDFHQLYSQDALPIKKDYSLSPETAEEKQFSEKKLLKSNLQVKHNPLQYTNIVKVRILLFAAILSMAAEYLVFRNIAENALGMPRFEASIVGSFAIVFTKLVQVFINKYVKTWISENSLKARKVFTKLLIALVVLIFVNAFVAGISNIHNVNQQKKLERLEYVSSQIEMTEESGGDTEELQNEFKTLQEDYSKESGFFQIIKFLAIAFLGILAIGCGSVLWSVGDLYWDTLKLKKKLENLNEKLARTRSNFQYIQTTYDRLLMLQRDIIHLQGQKHFLERLMSKDQDESLKFSNQK